MKLRSISAILVVLFLASMVFAQGSYSGSRFTATFNGPVTISNTSHPTNTDVTYRSSNGNIVELVTVRSIDHDIAVDFSSSQFYRSQAAMGYSADEAAVLTDQTNDAYYQGHPFSYSCVRFTYNNVTWYHMQRAIIIDSRTVIFIAMEAPATVTDSTTTTDAKGGNTAFTGWVDFEGSLSIR